MPAEPVRLVGLFRIEPALVQFHEGHRETIDAQAGFDGDRAHGIAFLRLDANGRATGVHAVHAAELLAALGIEINRPYAVDHVDIETDDLPT